ncbi:MAG: hypothetical protein HYR58_01415, partial [Acidobacteria bacterium]|nr:hypothetical protein [Acidobacteriota bacterium]
MRIKQTRIEKALAEMGVEVRAGMSLAALTSLGIGGTTDLLRARERRHLPQLIRLLKSEGVPFRFLGGGS